MMKQIKNNKPRRHQMLFDTTLPFRAKVEKSAVCYNRKTKHKKDLDD